MTLIGRKLKKLGRNLIRPFTWYRRDKKNQISPLTLRILALNVFALAILALGVLYFDQYRRSLLESKVNSVVQESRVVATAVSEIAVTETFSTIFLNTNDLNRIINRLMAPISSRAQIFDNGGQLIADSRGSSRRLAGSFEMPGEFERNFDQLVDSLLGGLGSMRDGQPMVHASDIPEVQKALHGVTAAAVWQMPDGFLVIGAAVPLRVGNQVVGALFFTEGADEVMVGVSTVRRGILVLFFCALVVSVALSVFFARSIVRPVCQLAAAADDVRDYRRKRVEIPDFSDRNDEIGELSASLRTMTAELYQRVDTLEAFAADVAHELKNPLTSIRSALETATMAKDPEGAKRMLALAQRDVERMNRLITDISAASRLDGEMSRAELELVDVADLLNTFAGIYDKSQEGGPAVKAIIDTEAPLKVLGVESRLGQVMQNLIGNALSFSPDDGVVSLRAKIQGDKVLITVSDQGPGIPAEDINRIFERFYSERPGREAFGQHSGLGLSISKQIVETLDGTLQAENIIDGLDGSTVGARFTVTLPLTGVAAEPLGSKMLSSLRRNKKPEAITAPDRDAHA